MVVFYLGIKGTRTCDRQTLSSWHHAFRDLGKKRSQSYVSGNLLFMSYQRQKQQH